MVLQVPFRSFLSFFDGPAEWLTYIPGTEGPGSCSFFIYLRPANSCSVVLIISQLPLSFPLS